MSTVLLILTIATGCYEVVARVVPTTKPISIIGKILEVLNLVSNAFENKKDTKYKKAG